jgi:hypothetical protein
MSSALPGISSVASGAVDPASGKSFPFLWSDVIERARRIVMQINRCNSYRMPVNAAFLTPLFPRLRANLPQSSKAESVILADLCGVHLSAARSFASALRVPGRHYGS